MRALGARAPQRCGTGQREINCRLFVIAMSCGARTATSVLPELPQAYNGKLTLDAEGIVLLPDGSRLISDEYGPSIYRFSAAGAFMGAHPVASSVN